MTRRRRTRRRRRRRTRRRKSSGTTTTGTRRRKTRPTTAFFISYYQMPGGSIEIAIIRRAREGSKNEIHQNLTPKKMSKSNQVHLWRFGRTGALIFTQKWLNRAKTGVLRRTLKKFPRPCQGVSRVQGTQLSRINWKIKDISSGLVTRRHYFFQKRTTFGPKFPSWGIWPIWKDTVEKSQTDATSAITHPLMQALWIDIWRRIVEKNQTNATCVIMHPLKQGN